MPRVAKSKEFDSRKVNPHVREAKIMAEGPIGLEVEPLQVVDGPKAMDFSEAMAFAEDKLVVLIHPSPEKFPEDPVYLSVNGRQAYVWRNQKTLMPRKYVERLARAKADNVNQDVTAREPKDFNKLTITASPRYPFRVLFDPAGDKGSAWLQHVLEEA